MKNSTVLDVRNLTKIYDAVPAIDDVSFKVVRGEVIGFVGLNGAGKSTTINILLGFLRASSGSVALFGRPVMPETAHVTHNQIGFASGDMSLFGNLTGKQYIAFISRRYKLNDTKRLNQLVGRFNPQLNKKISDLSRGNKQKVALIAAFLHSPELVILDEPSSGLDPLMQQLFVELIKEETKRGTTIFMSSHYLTEVVDVCSRVLLIREGKLIKDIPAEQLISAGGKMVRIVSRHEVKPPTTAERVVQKRHPGGFELSFVYKADPAKLQMWLGGISYLVDITINDHSIESAFDNLYAIETDGAQNV